jgi:hypothetical protein
VSPGLSKFALEFDDAIAEIQHALSQERRPVVFLDGEYFCHRLCSSRFAGSSKIKVSDSHRTLLWRQSHLFIPLSGSLVIVLNVRVVASIDFELPSPLKFGLANWPRNRIDFRGSAEAAPFTRDRIRDFVDYSIGVSTAAFR